MAAAIPKAAGWNDKAPGIAAREIASRRSIVWHEERVPDEHRVFQHVAHIGRRMTRSIERFHIDRTDAKSLAVLEQTVDTGARRGHGLVVEQIAQNLLDLPDMGTDAERAAELYGMARPSFRRCRLAGGSDRGVDHEDCSAWRRSGQECLQPGRP